MTLTRRIVALDSGLKLVKNMEQTLIILKPDALQRSLVGEIITRFEKKGFKIIGLKMMTISEVLIREHYGHHKDKPFFEFLKKYMQSAPCIVMLLEGLEVIRTARILCGQTESKKADIGTIRGDLAMSTRHNLVHASDSKESAEQEIKRFFKPEEFFEFKKIDFEQIYSVEERE